MNKKYAALAIIVVLVLAGIYAFQQKKEIAVHCETTKGPLEIVVKSDWSPRGAARFLELVDDGFYTHLPLFRCIDGFICQFGASVPKPNAKKYLSIDDDAPKKELQNFKAGYLSFAGYGPNTRAQHVFIAFNAVPSLGTQSWETPFGYVTDASMQSTVSRFNTSYGESAPYGSGPEPQKIEQMDGDAYLKAQFSQLDYFISCVRK